MFPKLQQVQQERLSIFFLSENIKLNQITCIFSALKDNSDAKILMDSTKAPGCSIYRMNK